MTKTIRGLMALAFIATASACGDEIVDPGIVRDASSDARDGSATDGGASGDGASDGSAKSDGSSTDAAARDVVTGDP